MVQPFTRDFAAITAEEFVPFIKRHLPRLAGIYVGENFRFGQGRKGDVAMLVEEGRRHGISVFSAPRVNLNGEPISSTRIRERIQSGDMKGAAALLGYVYTAEGIVVHGKHLGRTIGFPTLNLGWSPDLRPLYGVYAVRVSGAKSYGWLPAVANYGLRPTVKSRWSRAWRFTCWLRAPTGRATRLRWSGSGSCGRRKNLPASTNCVRRSPGMWPRPGLNFPCRKRPQSRLIFDPACCGPLAQLVRAFP